MAIDPLIARPPIVNWDAMGDPFKSYVDASNQRSAWDTDKARKLSLADLPRTADGSPDFSSLFDRLSSAGDFEAAMKIAPIARQQTVDAQTLKASQEFSDAFRPGGPMGGGAAPQQSPMTPNPGNVSSPVQPNDPTMTHPPSVVAAANAPAPPITWGDGQTGEPGSLPPPVAPVAAPAPPAAPAAPRVAPPGPVTSANPAANDIPRLIALSSNPRLGEAQRGIAKTMLEHALKTSDLPEAQKNYALYRAQGGTEDFTTWSRANSAAGSTRVNVNTGGENEFDKEFGKKQADRWNGYIAGAQQAQRKLVDLQQMRQISNEAGNPGAQASVKEFLGPYAAAVGVNIEGLPGIQAYSSIIQRLAPQQRVPGSGSTSDVEFKGMVRSMPGLMNHPQAREIVLDTMEALTRMEIAEGEIATRLATKEITRAQAEVELRRLGDPMKQFAEWRKANPQLYGQALKEGGSTPAPTGAPRTDVVPQSLRNRSVEEQKRAAPAGSIINENGQRQEKQPDGTWKPINGR